jgi:hypothetical protein
MNRREVPRTLLPLLLTLLAITPVRAAENAKISGRVVDRETGKGIAGAEVELSNSAGGQGFFRARAGGDGSFTLDRVAPDRWYNLTAGARGYSDFQLMSWQFPSAQREAQLVIPLDRAGTLEVSVTAADGRTPIPTAKVAIRSERPDTWWEGYRPPPAAQWTGKDGRTSFADIGAGSYTVQVEAGALLAQELRRVMVRRGETTKLPVKMVKPASIAGTVRLADGSSAAGISVTARGAAEAVSTTDADGSFTLGELAPGKYRLETSHEGFEPAAFKDLVTLREGGSRTGVTLTVTPRPAELAFVLNREVFTPGQAARVGQRSFRVGVVDYALFRIPAESVLDPNRGPSSRVASGDTTALESVERWSRPTADGPPYSWREEEIEVPGELEPGAYLLRGRAGALERRIAFFVSDLGLLVKRSPSKLLVSVGSLKTGLPLAGVPIYVVPDPSPQPLGTWSDALKKPLDRRTVTDGRGLLILDLDSSPQRLRVVAASDFAGVSVVDVPLSGAAEQGGDKLFLYTDRPIYRPGQTLYWKAFARKLTPNGYAMPDVSGATISLNGPDGASVSIPPANLSAHGSADGAVSLPADLAVGNWSLAAEAGRARGTAQLRIEEYRKPEYQVEVKPERATYVNGDEVKFTIAANYFFGSPVFGASVRYTLFESHIRRDEDWDAEDGDEAQPLGYGRVLKGGEARLDADGRAALSFIPDRVAYDRTLTLEAEVVDASNRAVSGRASAIMGRALFVISVRPSQEVVDVGAAVSVEVTARDFTGAPVAADVTLELDQDAWNPLERRYTRSTRPLAALDVAVGPTGKAIARLTPSPARSGSLILRARADDARGNRVTDETTLWVWDARASDYAYRYPTLEAFADKRSYSPGDTARVVINTEVAGATVLATVEAQEIGDVQVVKLSGHTGLVRVPLTARDAPNCFVSLHVRSGKEIRSKVLEIPVAAQRHDLKITVKADRDVYKPRDHGTILLETRDANGAPVSAEVSVGVVDEAIYALRRDDTPDPHDVFYGQRPNWVTTVVAFPALYYGGADKGGREEVRRDFRDVALWAPTVQTGADGRGKTELDFPDNLTTWRITSRGATDDTRVGSAVSKTLVTQDVVARIAGPRAFVTGDRAELVSVVTNRSTGPLTKVDQSLEASGAAKVSGAQSKRADIPKGGESRQTWNVEIPKPAANDWSSERTAKFIARAHTASAGDAVEALVPVVPRAVALHPHGADVVSSGATTIAVPLPSDLMLAGSSVSVELAASPIGLAKAGLDYLLGYSYACTEQTSNAILPACAFLDAARAAKVTPPGWEHPETRLKPYVDKLLALASPQGGWGWWQEGEADPFLTVLALDALAHASKLGVSAPNLDGAMQMGGFRLLRQLDQVRSNDGEAYVYAHLVTLLSLPNTKTQLKPLADWCDATALVLSSQRDGLGSAGLALAARSLAESGKSAEARAALEALMKRAVSDNNGLHWASDAGDDDWFGDPVETTSYALSALCAVSPKDSRADAILAWLARQRRGPRWISTRTSAPAVIALADYARIHPADSQPDQKVKLTWNGQAFGERTYGAADLWRAQPDRIIAMPASLKPGANTLGISREGSGRLFVSWEATAMVPSPGPPNPPGAGASITRAYLRAERTTDRRGRPRLLATPMGAGESFRVGDAVLVRLTLHAEKAQRWVMVEDPRVAGLEVEDAQPAGAEWPWGSHAEIRDRKVALFVDWLDAGDTVIEYLARPELNGVFTALPAVAGPMYEPDRQVRSGEQIVTIAEK